MFSTNNQENSPAAKEALDSQVSYINDVTQKMFAGLQKVGELNLQLAQNIMKASVQSTQQALKGSSPTEAMAATAATMQPITESTQQYATALQEIAAGLQVDIADVTEKHLPEAKRTATTLVQEVQQRGLQQAERLQSTFQEAGKVLTKPVTSSSSTAGTPSSMTSSSDKNQSSASRT
jgi:phasin family protein